MYPHQVARRGVVRTFQLTKALSKLTVLDNVRLGATGQRGERIFNTLLPWTWKAQERAITERANELLARFKLDTKSDDLAGSLSGGQRKLLEMARALMTEPTVVMLDEPMAGVNPALTQSLLGHIKSLRDEGMTVVFVEHDMDVIRDISDWVVVMAQGSVIAESTPGRSLVQQRGGRRLSGQPPRSGTRVRRRGKSGGRDGRSGRGRLENAEAETLETGGDLSEPDITELRRENPMTELTPAEFAATPEEHARLAEGALVRADGVVAGYIPGVNILRELQLLPARG